MQDFAEVKENAKNLAIYVEVLALKIELLLGSLDVVGLRKLVDQAKRIKLAELASADVKVLAVLREAEGTVNIIEKDWEEAETSFKLAFQHYHESGHTKTRDMLILQACSSILCEAVISPFSSPEAQMFLSDDTMASFSALWNAHFERSHHEYLSILEGLSSNDLLKNMDLVTELQRAILTGFLGKVVSAYSSLSLSYLSKELKVSQHAVMQTLLELIIDKKIDGRLDEVAGVYVRKTGSSNSDSVHTENLKKISKMVNSLASSNLNINRRSDFR